MTEDIYIRPHTNEITKSPVLQVGLKKLTLVVEKVWHSIYKRVLSTYIHFAIIVCCSVFFSKMVAKTRQQRMTGEAPVEIFADGDSGVSDFNGQSDWKEGSRSEESSLKENIEKDHAESSNNGCRSLGVFYSGREGVKQQRWRCQRERQKSNRFKLAKQQLCTCIILFCMFFFSA